MRALNLGIKYKTKRFLSVKLWTKKLLVARLFLILILLATAYLLFVNKGQNYNFTPEHNAVSDKKIAAYEKSSSLVDKRLLLSQYLNKEDYNSAKKVSLAIADDTKTSDDYLEVLRICALYDVSGKEACVEDATSKLKPFIDELSFRAAYTTGSLLEKTNTKKESVVFYQRALSAYDDSQADEYTMSKDELKKHIDEITK